MKFDTKTAHAMDTKQCYLKDNTFIPTSVIEACATDTTPPQGRQICFEPKLFFTPVLASQRALENSTDAATNQRLLTPESVDTLTQQLEALFLGQDVVSRTTTSTTKKVAFDDCNKDCKDCEDCNSKSCIGRFEESIVSTKTQCVVSVKRSCRLANNKNKH